MESLSKFLDMDGYGDFIWSAYGIAAVVLIGLAVQSVVSLKRAEQMLQQVRAVRRGEPNE